MKTNAIISKDVFCLLIDLVIGFYSDIKMSEYGLQCESCTFFQEFKWKKAKTCYTTWQAKNIFWKEDVCHHFCHNEISIMKIYFALFWIILALCSFVLSTLQNDLLLLLEEKPSGANHHLCFVPLLLAMAMCLLPCCSASSNYT